jgi:oxygen-independent coproporphyrinogen-3 oxidase
VVKLPEMFREQTESCSVYVGIPFCKTICTYCDFNVYAHRGKLFEGYVEALAIEIETVARDIRPPRRARSIGLGGGTPSILPTPLLGRVLESVYSRFELERGSEVTLEANPGTVDLEKLRTLRALGVNRLSLGVQSFDDHRLKALNRNHKSAQSKEAYELARRAGFDNINLDLIFGLPEQEMDDWARTLDRALAWQPQHLSLYALQVEQGTALERQIAKGRLHSPDPDLAADMFCMAEERLAAAGFEHYEISNYARPGYRSRHNLTYWLNLPYLGFGAGAHSYYQGVRYSNVLKPGDYIARLKHGETVVATREEIGPELEIGETLMLGLRLEEGIAFEDFQARFGKDIRDLHAATIAQLQEWGLLQVGAGRMRLTGRARLVSNQVLWRFLPDT